MLFFSYYFNSRLKKSLHKMIVFKFMSCKKNCSLRNRMDVTHLIQLSTRGKSNFCILQKRSRNIHCYKLTLRTSHSNWSFCCEISILKLGEILMKRNLSVMTRNTHLLQTICTPFYKTFFLLWYRSCRRKNNR